MDDAAVNDADQPTEQDPSIAHVEAPLVEDAESADAAETELEEPGPSRPEVEPPAEEPAEVEPTAEKEPPEREPAEVEPTAAEEPPAEEPATVEEASAEKPAVAVASGLDTALPDVAAGPRSPEVPWWPFLLYVAAWLGLVGASMLTLSYDRGALPAIQQEPYPYLILGGLVLAATGPVLALFVWLVVWVRAGKGRRSGLLTSALVRGAGVTLLGVLMWWGTLVAVDALRLGIIG